MTVHVVIGPPAAGKSTWARTHATPTDVIIDFDLIALALSAPDPTRHPHDHSGHVRTVTKAARAAAIEAAFKLNGCDVYLIHSTPSAARLAEYRRRGAQVHTIDPGRDVVLERIKRERPALMATVARRWYASGGPPPAGTTPAVPARHSRSKRTGGDRRSTTAKGLGWPHQQQVARLKARHRDGAPCPLCGLPMYLADSLDADHTTPRSLGGTVADRLTHARCNRSRGNGTRTPGASRLSVSEPPRHPKTTREW